MIGGVTLGARVLVINEENQILLVKHTYVSGWHMPGGGVKLKETTKDAAVRELREETGLIASAEPVLFGIYHKNFNVTACNLRGNTIFNVLNICGLKNKQAGQNE